MERKILFFLIPFAILTGFGFLIIGNNMSNYLQYAEQSNAKTDCNEIPCVCNKPSCLAKDSLTIPNMTQKTTDYRNSSLKQLEIPIRSQLTQQNRNSSLQQLEIPIQSQSAQQNRISLLFEQYPSLADAPKVHSLMHQYLTQPTDYIQVERNNLYLDFPDQRKLLLADSIKGIQDKISQTKTMDLPIYAIGYDFEHWDATPLTEQANPLDSMSTASDLVHSAGYRFAYVPDSQFLRYNYRSYDWTKVDVAWLQIGYDGRTYYDYLQFITDVIYTIRSENPHAIIIVQLSLRNLTDSSFDGPVAQFNAEVDAAIMLHVDAISIVYSDPSKSSNFTISNLEAILSHISSVRQ